VLKFDIIELMMHVMTTEVLGVRVLVFNHVRDVEPLVAIILKLL